MLEEVLSERCSRNPQYSLRAFARDLGVSAAFLSQVFHGRKKLSPKRAAAFAALLGIKKTALDDVFSLELEKFKLLSQWHHFAILDLTYLKSFRPDFKWIARTLGINPVEARTAVSRLVRLGLLDIKGSGRSARWTKTSAKIVVPANRPDPATREFHSQMIEKAQKVLMKTAQSDYDSRLVAGTTMAVNSARIKEARERMNRFRREMLDFLTEGECDELYQFNMQFFMLTKKPCATAADTTKKGVTNQCISKFT